MSIGDLKEELSNTRVEIKNRRAKKQKAKKQIKKKGVRLEKVLSRVDSQSNGLDRIVKPNEPVRVTAEKGLDRLMMRVLG